MRLDGLLKTSAARAHSRYFPCFLRAPHYDGFLLTRCLPGQGAIGTTGTQGCSMKLTKRLVSNLKPSKIDLFAWDDALPASACALSGRV
jgi:hypothetical protein